MSPFVKGLLVGVAVYWGVQHFTGALTSGLGARQSPGAGKTPGG
jgi:hypothetical protein